MRAFTIFVICFLTLFLATCKKGEDDPLFSLRTRKARLEGDWRLQKASLSVGIRDSTGSYGAYEYEFSESGYKRLNTSTRARFEGPSALNIRFSKKGEFSLVQNLDNLRMESSGTWDFQGRVGKMKNKETLTVSLSTFKGITNLYFFFNKGNFNFTYRIKELRDKKLVLVNNEEMLEMSQDYGVYISSEYTFVQE